METNFKKHKTENTFTKLNKLFCINKEIETLQSRQLKLLTTPMQH